MSVIKVNSGGLQGLVGQMQTGVSELRSLLADMDSRLGPLRENWEGEAKESYHAAQRQWNTQIDDMNRLLQELGTAVQTSNENYMAGESRNRQSWA